MLELKNITRSYLQYYGGSFIKKKKRIEAINNISFKISKNEKVGIVGLNGSGKSTLIKLVLGVLVQDEGEIKLFGKDPVKNRKSLSRNYGVIFGQKSNLIWDLSARNAYEILKEIYSINNNEFEKILEFLKEHIDIKEIIDVPIRQLSLGQRMKLEVVSLLLHRPKLIVFDEALIGIDFMTKRDINRLLDVYIKKNNASLILTSHDIKDINEFTDRYLIMDKGRILCDMTKSELDQYKDFSTLILKFNSIKAYNNQIDFLNLDINQCIIDSKEYEGNVIVKILSNKNYIDKLINGFNSKYYDSAIIEPVDLENLVELYKKGFII